MASKINSNLTEKQKRFAEHFIQTQNATESYVEAGYAGTRVTAGVEGHKLLKKPKIVTYITNKLQEANNPLIDDTNTLLLHLATIATGEATEQVPLFMGEGVQELVEARPSKATQIKAIELLWKIQRTANNQRLETLKLGLEVEKLEMEIEKLREELKQDVTQEDKLTNLIALTRQSVEMDMRKQGQEPHQSDRLPALDKYEVKADEAD